MFTPSKFSEMKLEGLWPGVKIEYQFNLQHTSSDHDGSESASVKFLERKIHKWSCGD
jgi:hypothetical protein